MKECPAFSMLVAQLGILTHGNIHDKAEREILQPPGLAGKVALAQRLEHTPIHVWRSVTCMRLGNGHLITYRTLLGPELFYDHVWESAHIVLLSPGGLQGMVGGSTQTVSALTLSARRRRPSAPSDVRGKGSIDKYSSNEIERR